MLESIVCMYIIIICQLKIQTKKNLLHRILITGKRYSKHDNFFSFATWGMEVRGDNTFIKGTG